jgi:hypothetical protein
MNRLQFINEEALAAADIRIAPAGFRYGFVDGFIREWAYEKLRTEIPDVRSFQLVDKMSGGGHKRFYVGPAYAAGKDGGCACMFRQLPTWRAFMQETASSSAMHLMSEKMGIGFNSLANFGLTFGDGGCVQEAHVDGAVREYDEGPVKSKWATIVYFNPDSKGAGGTCVYDTDRATVLFQAPSMRNGLFFFEQHPQAWHGFPMMPEGAERRILSLAYSNEKRPINLQIGLAHQLTCRTFWKSIIKK